MGEVYRARDERLSRLVALIPTAGSRSSSTRAARPKVFLVDSRGTLRYHGRIASKISSPDLKNALEAFLAGRPIRPAETKLRDPATLTAARRAAARSITSSRAPRGRCPASKDSMDEPRSLPCGCDFLIAIRFDPPQPAA
jgi:hypothetical protein